MKKVAWVVGAIGLLMSTGCASIVSKSVYPVSVNSTPSGASVTVRDRRGIEIHKGSTPTTVSLNASAGFFQPARYTFLFEKNGYNPASVSLSAGLDPWYLGNIVFGGLIGWLIVDPATGAMWKLDDLVTGSLSPSGGQVLQTQPVAPVAADERSTSDRRAVAENLKKLKELRDQGVLTEEEYQAKRKALVDKL